MIRTTPLRFTIRQFSHILLTLERTFMGASLHKKQPANHRRIHPEIVNTSTPVSVTATVCSKWAAYLPSLVTTTQLSVFP